MNRFKQETGAALILVLTSLMILTTLVVEFAYNTHVTYEVAAGQRDRLKAYYLARSALNFLKLEFYVEKKLRSQFADALKNLKDTGVTSAPLCAQIPLSTGLLRAVSEGSDPFADSESEPEEDQKPEPGKPESGKPESGKPESGKPEKTGKSTKKKETKEAASADTFEGLSHTSEEFLQFDGDFEAKCGSEQNKLNINLFRGAPTDLPLVAGETPVPATPPGGTPPTAVAPPVNAAALYEEQKQFLLSILSQPDFEDFLPDIESRRKLATAIADWVDADDRINEAPGIQGSGEESEYADAAIKYKVKNGRYASLEELLLVAGMTDDIFAKLKDMVTIYGDQKLNVCAASEPTVKAFVMKYAQSAGGLPLDPKDEQRWTLIQTALDQACEQPNPQPAQIASAITGALGQTTEGGQQANQNLASQITTTDRFLSLEAEGTVDQIRVRLKAVIDTANSNPNLWKTLYFQVE